TLPELFAAQAMRMPDAVAAVYEDQSLTYGELDARSSRLAHYLRTLGVGPEAIVGLCVERSPEMIIGLIRILKAGGAYLPLDPDSPRERLAFMLADADACVILTQSGLRGRLPEGARLVCLDDEQLTPATPGPVSPHTSLQPFDAAYVIYTSGSTGVPKGVVATHQNVVRLVIEPNYIAVSPDDVFLQAAPLGFDASTFEIWGALLNGARLVIY